MSQKFVRKLVYTIVLLLLNVSAFADHFAGADLTYKCVGGNNYLITLSFYRDCGGIPAPVNATLYFKCSTNQSLNFSANINRILGTGVEITPGCSAIPTRCSGSGYLNYGVEEYVFQGEVTIPPCNFWTISYSGGNRNAITTVPNNTGNDWFIPAMLNNQQAFCNSSPTFTNKPIGISCLGQPSCFNHGAIDANGDSLSYSFYSPYTNMNLNTVTYGNPYSYTNFLLSATPITLNTVTGDICFSPTISLITITGVQVKEYRKIGGNYTLIGTVYRDLQLSVQDCNNSIPKISGMDTLNTHTYNPNDSIYWLETCYQPNKIISFDINGYDSDTLNPATIGSPEKFSLSWNNGIPQGNFQSFNDNSDSAYAHFSWALQQSDISNLPKCFTVTAKDQACPYFGSQTYSYCITVRGMTVKIGSDTSVCRGEKVTYLANADTTTVNYLWKVNGIQTTTPVLQDSFIFNTAAYPAGNYVISIETNDGGITSQCPGKDEAVVTIIHQPHIQGTLSDTSFCAPGGVLYDAGMGSSFLWMDSLFNPIDSNQTVTITQGGRYLVLADGGYKTRCFDQDTFVVVSINRPIINNDTCIWLNNAPFQLEVQNSQSNISYEWNNGNFGTSQQVNTSGVYTVSAYHPSIDSDIKCVSDAEINVIDRDAFIKSIRIQADNNPIATEIDSTGNRIICNHQKLKLFAPIAPNGHLYNYNWFKDNTLVSNTSFYIFKESVLNDYKIVLSIENGCEDQVNVKTISCIISIPNVITPDGNGVNDKFEISGIENFPNSKLYIFNRWGSLIYSTNNYLNDWDGLDVSDGIYFWILMVQDGQNTEMQGNLTVIRK